MSSQFESPTIDLSEALQVRIRPIPSTLQAGKSLALDVAVRNNLDHPVTILTWDSPLDPKAGILGIFHARDVEDDHLLQGDFLRFRRKMPPPKDSFVEIGGNSQLVVRAILPGLKLAVGTEYVIQARGRWQAVWDRPMEDIEDELLETLSEASFGEACCDSERFEVEDVSSGSE